MSKFSEAVFKIVKNIPYGKVVSYGQVALYLGAPRAARQVGWVLSMSKESDMIPWWRVVNNSGRISIKGKFTQLEQKQLLLQEGIRISKNFTFNIERYRFNPDNKFFKLLDLDSLYIQRFFKDIKTS